MTASSPDLAAAIVAALDDAALDALADRLLPRLTQRIANTAAERVGWLDTRQAAAYAGCAVSTLQRAAAAGDVDSCQDCENGKRWYRPAWIDAWRMDATQSAARPYTDSDASKMLPERRTNRVRPRQQA